MKNQSYVNIYADLFGGYEKFVLYGIPLLMFFTLPFVPEDYSGILPNNMMAHIKYEEYFSARNTWVADITGIYFTLFVFYTFVVYFVVGLSPRSKRIMKNHTKEMVERGYDVDIKHPKLYALFWMFCCCINFIFIFIDPGGTRDSDKDMYWLVHSSSILYLAFLCVANYGFIIMWSLFFVYMELGRIKL